MTKFDRHAIEKIVVTVGRKPKWFEEKDKWVLEQNIKDFFYDLTPNATIAVEYEGNRPVFVVKGWQGEEVTLNRRYGSSPFFAEVEDTNNAIF